MHTLAESESVVCTFPRYKPELVKLFPQLAHPELYFQPNAVYPESDGKPMAENMTQFDMIVCIVGGLAALFADVPSVLVAGDLLWYPFEGYPDVAFAPDAMVVFGVQKWNRKCYRQWEEKDVTPQVVFEIVSDSNSRKEMLFKRQCYEQFGVLEYYEYDPARGHALGLWRDSADEQFRVIGTLHGWRSPLLKVTFEMDGKNLVVRRPDGQELETFVKTSLRADKERIRADKEHVRANRERLAKEKERIRAENECARADNERREKEMLLAKLRAMGIDPDSLLNQ